MHGLEIERKFRVHTEKLPPLDGGAKITQVYVFISQDKELRVRLQKDRYELALKIHMDAMSREEFQYEIPQADAERLMQHAEPGHPIEKIRYKIIDNDMTWEVDWFLGQNEGLVLAEVELENPNQPFVKPAWLGVEVTEDLRYYNQKLYQNPFKSWA